MWEYTDKVKEHFLHPKNIGKLENANGIGEVGSLACGDALKLFIRVEDNCIVDASFQTFGCASAIASSSALTEMIKGKTLEEASTITNKDIANFLGGLPKEKMHCSVMGEEALEAAIRDYRGEPAKPHAHEGKVICKCFGITDTQIIKAVLENNITSTEEVTHYTKAGGGCGDCTDEVRRIIEETLQGKHAPSIPDLRKPAAPAPAAAPLSNVQRMQKVMSTIEEIIRPRLEQDGGDIELIDIDGVNVKVALRGTCTNCPSSKITLENLVQKTLQEHVDPAIVVHEVTQ